MKLDNAAKRYKREMGGERKKQIERSAASPKSITKTRNGGKKKQETRRREREALTTIIPGTTKTRVRKNRLFTPFVWTTGRGSEG